MKRERGANFEKTIPVGEPTIFVLPYHRTTHMDIQIHMFDVRYCLRPQLDPLGEQLMCDDHPINPSFNLSSYGYAIVGECRVTPTRHSTRDTYCTVHNSCYALRNARCDPLLSSCFSYKCVSGADQSPLEYSLKTYPEMIIT